MWLLEFLDQSSGSESDDKFDTYNMRRITRYLHCWSCFHERGAFSDVTVLGSSQLGKLLDLPTKSGGTIRTRSVYRGQESG
jgi:hypothetical protein